jgi:rhodanese-related sulfurtransferase
MKRIGFLTIGIGTLLGTGILLGNLQTTTSQNNLASMIEIVDSSVFKTKNTEEERIVLDVRTPEEYSEGHIPNSKNINFNDPSFITTLETLDKNKAYSIYCRSGNRSGQARELMRSLGFTNVLDLQGGVVSWERNGNTLCVSC